MISAELNNLVEKALDVASQFQTGSQQSQAYLAIAASFAIAEQLARLVDVWKLEAKIWTPAEKD